MAKRKLHDKRILLTGASSGIGYALAVQLASLGNRLLVVARREQRLKDLVHATVDLPGSIEYLSGDLTDPEFRGSMVTWIQDEWSGTLDVLINNAGIGSIQSFSKSSAEHVRKIMEVNFFAPLELIRGHLHQLRSGIQPVICNIGSVLGHVALPGKSEYCASKFALHGFSDALRAELSAEQIDVVLVSPSTTRSEFFTSVLAGAKEQSSSRAMAADVVARKTVKAIEKGQRETILSWKARIGIWQDRFFPTWLSNQLGRWYQRQNQLPQNNERNTDD